MPETFLERGKRINAGLAPLDHKQYYPEEPEQFWDEQTVQTTAALGEGSLIDPHGSMMVDLDLSTPAVATGTVDIWLYNEAAGTWFLWSKYTFNTAEGSIIRVDVAGRKFQPLLTVVDTALEANEHVTAWVVRL